MRPAVEVWTQAVDAFLRSARLVADDPEIASVDYDVAAAIIAQDRAALVAEIVRFLLQKRTIDQGTAWAAMEIKAGRFGNG